MHVHYDGFLFISWIIITLLLLLYNLVFMLLFIGLASLINDALFITTEHNNYTIIIFFFIISINQIFFVIFFLVYYYCCCPKKPNNTRSNGLPYPLIQVCSSVWLHYACGILLPFALPPFLLLPDPKAKGPLWE